jgi:FkbM family methyltransferase
METGPINYESLVQEVYEAVLRQGDLAVDVGAHRGRHTLPMANKVFPGGQVLAIEPLPVCRTSLEKTLAEFRPELASVVKVHDCALSDYTGNTEFVVASDDLAYSGLKKRMYITPTRLQYLPVEVKRLDELCAKLSAVRFIKIDAEGGEYHILRGAEQTIRRFRPAVAFEFGLNSLAEYEVTPRQMFQFWAALNYKLFDIRGNWLGEEVFSTSAVRQILWDYVALPAENEDMVHAVASVLVSPPAWRRVSIHLENADNQFPASSVNVKAGGPHGIRGWVIARAAKLLRVPIRSEYPLLAGCMQSLIYSNRALFEIVRDRENDIRRHQDHLHHLSREFRELRKQLNRASSSAEGLANQSTSERAGAVDLAA